MRTISNVCQIFVFLALFLISPNVLAQNHSILELIDFSKADIAFTFFDDTQGGCLPQPNRVKDQLEAELRRNNFLVTNEKVSMSGLRVYFYALGGPSKLSSGRQTGCAVMWELDVTLVITASSRFNVPHGIADFADKLAHINIHHRSGMVSGPNDSQNQIEDVINDQIRTFFLEVQRSKTN